MSVIDSKDESALENLVIKDDKEVRTIILTLDFNWKNIVLYLQLKKAWFPAELDQLFSSSREVFFQKIVKGPSLASQVLEK